MISPSAEQQIRHNLRCEVTHQRCADLFPRICDIDDASRESLGPDWRCATCAAYTLLASLSQELERITAERDNAWGELGFTKTDLGNALHRAEKAERPQERERIAHEDEKTDHARTGEASTATGGVATASTNTKG